MMTSDFGHSFLFAFSLDSLKNRSSEIIALSKRNSPMRISFIGSGRVATHLAQAFAQQHDIVQIMSPNFANAQKLANLVAAQAINHVEQMNYEIDLCVIAVSDQAISTCMQQLSPYLKNTLVVHTSGSTHLHVLAKYYENVGVFYPLQTFSFERQIDWDNTPLFIEAAQSEQSEVLRELANSLSNSVYQYSSEQRLSLHLAAVFACNFSNYCYDMAKQIVDAQQVDFNLLFPLMLETAHKATQYDPQMVQTGPAMRGDQNILNMHQGLLADTKRDDLVQVYRLLSEQIMQRQVKS